VTGSTTLDDEPLTVGHLARRRITADLPEPKYRVPKPRTDFVRRTELLSRLERDRARPLVLLTAPAGYGKTTVLAQWTAERGGPFAWVTLDELDGDPEILADSIASALLRIGIHPGFRRRFVLVLDDAHVVPPEVLDHALVGILGWLPEGSQLAVASRCEPALALSRMRAQRMLVELRAADLSMSAGEALSLLRKAGLDLDATAVQTLARRTEGWPAALELAAISLTRGARASEHPPTPRGDDHLISEYFRAELLAPLSPAARRFLIRGSVLDRLSGPLCDEVLKCKGSATMLAELARGNVPLAPVDPSHEWYRLHDLFREMLQTELRRAEPETQAALHRRAGAWHGRAGDVDRAIDHARGAGDLDRTGELLWAHLPRYLGEGRNEMVQRWLSGITAERATGCTALALVAAHSNLALGNVDVAEQWARSAAVSLSETPAESAKCERAGVLIVEAWAGRSGARGMAEDATRAYELLLDDSPWRASCCLLRGTAALLIGDEAEAQQRLEEGAARGAVQAPDTASLCLAQLAVVAAQRDQAERASDFARRARSVIQEHGLGETPTSALVFGVCAAAAMREGRVDEAKAAASECLGLLHQLDESLSWYGAEARILLARVTLALGDVAGARELLADASRLGRRTSDVLVFRGWFDDAWDQFDARAETVLAGVATLTTAELRVLRFLPTHYSFHEIAQRLHVSSNTVKTHVHAVYRKLDAASRSEAVAHATEAGLLGG
jgi:LuxR family transcriptional regulator, maltose regulon positive regulatory protein